MPVDESVLRGLLARIKDIIEADHPHLGYVVTIFEAGDTVFYAPVNYATNLDAEGVRGVGEFLIQIADNPGDWSSSDGEKPDGYSLAEDGWS